MPRIASIRLCGGTLHPATLDCGLPSVKPGRHPAALPFRRFASAFRVIVVEHNATSCPYAAKLRFSALQLISMISPESEIDAALLSDGPISREKVLDWINNAKDLTSLSKLYRLTDQGYYRIQPDLGMDATCSLIQRYLLGCIKQDATGRDDIHSRFEASQDLRSWLCHLLDMKDTSPIIEGAVKAVTELFLTGDQATQYSIETAFLEHAFETAALRPYFEHWATDDRLRPAWDRALEWGKAHQDFTTKLIREHLE